MTAWQDLHYLTSTMVLLFSVVLDMDVTDSCLSTRQRCLSVHVLPVMPASVDRDAVVVIQAFVYELPTWLLIFFTASPTASLTFRWYRMSDLHWLPVRWCVILQDHYDCVSCSILQYATGVRRGLRSSASITTKLTTLRTRMTFGDRALAVAGLWIWNSLPSGMMCVDIDTKAELWHQLCVADEDLVKLLYETSWQSWSSVLSCMQTPFQIPIRATDAEKPNDSWIVLHLVWIMMIFAADYEPTCCTCTQYCLAN